MNPIYRFTVRGQQKNTTKYTQDDMASGYYDLSQGIGGIVTDEILPPPSPTKAEYCLSLKVNRGDVVKLGTMVSIGGGLYPYALTDNNKRILFFEDEPINTLDYPLAIEVEQDGYIYINYYRFPTYSPFNVELTEYDNRDCSPIYKDDLTKNYELEQSQQFFRVKLSGDISFIRDDYDWLDAQPFETQFILFINESFDGGKTWSSFLQGKFMKTDCKWDVDNKKCEVKPDTYDQYNDVMNGLEKEYDLIKLAPEMQKLSIVKRPLIQTYIPGDSVISCFVGGTYWEQDVVDSVDDADTLQHTYKFALTSRFAIWDVTADGTNIPEIAGRYIGKNGTYTKEDNAYYIKWEKSYNYTGGTGINDYISTFVIYRASDNKDLYYSDKRSSDGSISGDYTFSPAPDVIPNKGKPAATTEHYDIYTRWLINRAEVSGTKAVAIPTNDIVDDNRNYRYVVGLLGDYYYLSFNKSEKPTEWGLNNEGTYYAPPYTAWGQRFYPIAKSSWGDASVWFSFGLDGDLVERQAWAPWTLRDTFKLSSVINVLLEQFSSVRHLETEECSRFLYSDRNPITYQQFTLLITQKSNLLHGNYTQAAQKAETTLKTILDALKNIYQCYWYIENGLLKIEHIAFFKNGGTYTETNPGIGVDLTKLENVKNRKQWGYLTSNYEFDKSDMPARYQFAWMDDVTEMFDGFPLEIRSKYVTEDQIEDITVSNITTDVDYMLMNPSAISQDGFALFAGVYTNLWTDRPLFYVHDGYIGTNGDVVYDADGDGKGWLYTKFDNVVPGVTYKVLNSAGGQINGFYFHFYDISGDSIGRAETTNGQITIPDDCYIMAMSWRAQQDASPTTLGIVETSSIYLVQAQQLGLPFVQREMYGADLNIQNGYLSWMTLLPNYWTYDLPSKNVTINETDYTLSHISRKKKQKVKFPTLEDLDTSKLVKTPLGNGQIEKISVNLSSRMNEVTLKYDTE